MLYFKHMSDMSDDKRVKRLIARHGVEGYGWYCLILERISKQLLTEDPMPDLEETAEDLADFYNGNTSKIEEIVHFLIQENLVEIQPNSGRVVCPKIYKFLQSSQTRSESIRKLIKNYTDHRASLLSQTVSDNPREIGKNPFFVSDSLRLSQGEQNRREEKKDEERVRKDPTDSLSSLDREGESEWPLEE